MNVPRAVEGGTMMAPSDAAEHTHTDLVGVGMFSVLCVLMLVTRLRARTKEDSRENFWSLLRRRTTRKLTQQCIVLLLIHIHYDFIHVGTPHLRSLFRASPDFLGEV